MPRRSPTARHVGKDDSEKGKDVVALIVDSLSSSIGFKIVKPETTEQFGFLFL